MPTDILSLICGLRKMWAFGSSTSQSRNWTFPRESAKLVAIVVLPVPPFPLATEIIIATTNFSPLTRRILDTQSDSTAVLPDEE
jgi:hypothetical protein